MLYTHHSATQYSSPPHLTCDTTRCFSQNLNLWQNTFTVSADWAKVRCKSPRHQSRTTNVQEIVCPTSQKSGKMRELNPLRQQTGGIRTDARQRVFIFILCSAAGTDVDVWHTQVIFFRWLSIYQRHLVAFTANPTPPPHSCDVL